MESIDKVTLSQVPAQCRFRYRKRHQTIQHYSIENTTGVVLRPSFQGITKFHIIFRLGFIHPSYFLGVSFERPLINYIDAKGFEPGQDRQEAYPEVHPSPK